MNYQKEIYKLMDTYKLNTVEKEKLFKIMYPILNHLEFKRRMTKEFMHHGTITLGEHIIKDTIKTYLLCKKYNEKTFKVSFTDCSIVFLYMHYNLDYIVTFDKNFKLFDEINLLKL